MKITTLRALIFLIIFPSAKSMIQEKNIWPNNKNLVLKVFSGPQALEHIPAVIDLYCTIFEGFPNLYQKTEDLAYETEYLTEHFKSEDSIISLLFDKDNNVVGYASAIPLSQEQDVIKQPFIEAGIALNKCFYIGEAMLAPAYRNLKITTRWKDFFTQEIKRRGYTHVGFLTVNRPHDHPSKPAHYETNDSLWSHYGAQKHPTITAQIPWLQSDTHQEENNSLAVWTMSLENVELYPKLD